MKDIIVIGGGAAGVMAAIFAAQAGGCVTLVEKNEKLGKKIYITGKGRCNLTNSLEASDYFDNVSTNKKFLYSAFRSFDNNDLCAFFEEAGLKLKTERGGRIFPVSDKASDVTKVLGKKCKDAGVKILLNTEIKDIFKSDGNIKQTDGSEDMLISANAVIIATGGLSYPTTGSTGDGYTFAKKFGHEIVEPIPSLVPIDLKEDFIGTLEGLSLRNVSIKIKNESDKKILFEDFGEMLFTDNGVSGPLILKATSVAGREIYEVTNNKKGIKLYIDLKPALDEKQLDARLLRDFEENKNKEIKNSLSKLLPAKMIPAIIKAADINPHEKINNINRVQRANLLKALKGLEFTVAGLCGFDKAVITKGGVDVKKINPGTMESKLEKNIYFAGEVLDVDAFTGGFNLQAAFSTGRAAGVAAVKEEYETDSDRWTCRCRKKHNS